VSEAGRPAVRYESKPAPSDLLTLVMVEGAFPAEEWETWKSFCAVLSDAAGDGLVYFGADADRLATWPGAVGFPLRATWHQGKRLNYQVKVQEFRTATVPQDAFIPPTGYQAASLLDLL
jgi:hypothetical protein